MFIYKILNNKTKKSYYLSSTDYKLSIRRNRYKLNNNIYRNKELQKDYNLYGKDNFTYELVEEIDKSKLKARLIELKGLHPNNYNEVNKSNHPWRKESIENRPPATKLVKDADGDLLPLKFCVACELDKLEDSFVNNSLYCYSCRLEHTEEKVKEDEILEDISFL